MCKSRPLKALGIRYFSNHQKLLPIACFKPIWAYTNKKDPDGLYFYRTIKVILYAWTLSQSMWVLFLPTGILIQLIQFYITDSNWFITDILLAENFALKVAESFCPVIWRERPFLYYRVVPCSCQVGYLNFANTSFVISSMLLV